MTTANEPSDINDMYDCNSPAEFLAWFDDEARSDLLGNYPAKSEALLIAVRLLRASELPKESDPT